MITVKCKYWYNQWLVDSFPKTFTCKDAPVPPGPTPVSWDHLIGLGMFLGVYSWRTDGITNDAPKDMPTLISQFANAGGKLVQVQMLYEEGAVFTKGKGLQLDSTKMNYCANFRDMCAKSGVAVTFVLFDHCTLKNPTRWAVCPLNNANGGPFGQPLDIYSHFSSVSQYVTDVVKKLNGDSVAFEIINEGENASFAGRVRDLLKSLGVTRITTSGDNPGNLWRYSEHGQTSPSDVKVGQLPNTDGRTWSTADVKPICNAVRALVGGGLVFDGATDSTHSWKDFLNNIKQ